MKSTDETLTHDNDILEDYSLVPVPSCPKPHHGGYPSTVFVGSDIYLIGGPSNGPPSSLVSILDCQSHTWRDGPSMSVARAGASAYLIHGKIYVMEKSRKDDNWMEVLDIKTQTWSPLLSHGATEFRSEWFMINVFRGKFYAVAKKHYAYDPKEGTWEVMKRPKKFRYENAATCVINNVRYSYTSEGFFMWYDRNTNMWTKVKGLDLELFSTDSTYSIAEGCVLTICNHGGKLLVMWVPRFEEHNGKLQSKICCAKIAVEKCNGNEVWGKIEWGSEVLMVTSSYKFLNCVVSWI
ncbi:F-box/kelch-repeat protein [Raphanus sativus]|nr:F-box/kelch-repeat protein [Raphanus sativus]